MAISYVCTVKFVNKADPTWPVIITKIYAKFTHHDASTSEVSKPVNIAPGDDDTLESIDKCVKMVFGEATFSIGSTEFDTVGKSSGDSGPGCYPSYEFRLRPKPPETEHLGLAQRTVAALKKNQISKLKDLARLKKSAVAELPGIGDVAMADLERAFARHGLKFHE